MILYIADRNIRVDNADNQISYNSDYIAEFVFDDEWNGKIKTARFVQNGEHVDVVLVDDRCEIPPLKTGFVRIGVFSDSMTSTYADVYFKTSIKDGTGIPAEPPDDVYKQLIELIESGMLKGDDGLTPHVGSNNNWWIGDIDTGILARGYTPQKGVDYFTEGEVQQIQNEVSESIQANINHLEINKADKSELDKTNLSLDALWKMNRGQTWDAIEVESEAYSVDVPSGAKYVGIDKVGGKSVAWNQLANNFGLYGNMGQVTRSDNKYTYTFTALGTTIYDNSIRSINKFNSVSGHKYLEFFDVFCTKAFTVSIGTITDSWTYTKVTANVKEQKSIIATGNSTKPYLYIGAGMNYDNTFAVGDTFEISNIQLIDLTQMFGSTIADYIYSLERSQAGAGVEWFKKMFPADYYPYSEPTIISSQTDRVDVASSDGTVTQQITTGFPVLNSAGSVYDYIDLNGGKLYTWTYIEGNEVKALIEPVITDIEIPTELTDWLIVEAGGSITFHNADEGKRLLIPSKLSFVRKLDEVTV